jgi:hypothetical protein
MPAPSWTSLLERFVKLLVAGETEPGAVLRLLVLLVLLVVLVVAVLLLKMPPGTDPACADVESLTLANWSRFKLSIICLVLMFNSV